MIYGVDVSAYQPNFDFAAAARDGVDFAFIKSTEGTNWRSPNYSHQVRDARAAGLLVAAYHYVRGSDVAGQLANIRAMVSTDTPVILDVEEGAGSIASIRALNKAVNDAGYRTPLIYVPKWYWQGHMGSPDLSGLPPNWLSWYPDYVVRRKEAGVAKIPASVWNGFGGIPVAIVQFTSSLAVANYPNGSIDGNAYRGTRDQLAALLGGQEEDAVSADDVLYNKKIYGPNGDIKNLNDAVYWTNSYANRIPAMEVQIAGLTAAFNALADAVAADRDVDAAEIKAAVLDAMDEGTVKVTVAIEQAQKQMQAPEANA